MITRFVLLQIFMEQLPKVTPQKKQSAGAETQNVILKALRMNNSLSL